MAKNHDSVPKFSSEAEPLVGTSSKFKQYLDLQKPPAPYSQRRSPVDFLKLTSLQDFYAFSHSQDWQYPVIDTNQHENSLDKGTTRCNSQAQSDTSNFKRQHEFDETLKRNEQHLTKNSDDLICRKSCDEATSSSKHRTLNESVPPFKKGPLKLRKSWFNPKYKSLASHCKHFANQESEKQSNEEELLALDFPDEPTLEMEALDRIYRNSNRLRRSQMPTNFGTLIENPTDAFHKNVNMTSEASCSPSQSYQQCQKSCSPMDEPTPVTTTVIPNHETVGPPVPPKSTAPVVGCKTQHRLPLRERAPIKTCKIADLKLSKVSMTKPYSKKSNLTISKQLSLAHENDHSIDSPPPFAGTYFPPLQQQFDAYGFVRHNYYSHLKPTAQSPSKKQSSGSNLGRKGVNQHKGEKPVVSFQNRVSMHTINATKAQHNLQNHDVHPHHDPHHHDHPHHHHHLHHNQNPQSHVHHSSSSSSPHPQERGKSYVYLNDLDQHQYPTPIDEHLDVATCKPAARTLNTPAGLAPAINDEDEDDDASSTKSVTRPKRSTSQPSHSSSSSSSDIGNMKKKLKVFPAKQSKKRKTKQHGKNSTEISPHHNSSQEFNVTKGDEAGLPEPASENAKKGSTNSKLEEQASDDDGDTEGSSSTSNSSKSSKKHKDSTGSSGASNSTAKSKKGRRSCAEASQKKALSTNPCCYYINTCPSYTYGYQQGGYYGYGGYPDGAQSAFALPNSAYGAYGSPYDPNVPYSAAQWPLDPFSCCYPPHTEGPHQTSHFKKLPLSRCASPKKESPPPPCQAAAGYNQQPFSPQLWTNQCLEPFRNINSFPFSPNPFSGQATAPSHAQDLNGNYSQNGYYGNPYCCPMIFYCCPPQPEPPKDKKPCRRKKAVKKNVFQLPPALTSFPDKPRGCTLESPPKCTNCCPHDYCCASDGDCCNNFCCFENCKCPVGML